MPMLMTGIASDDGCGNGRALEIAAEHSLFATIVIPHGTVDVAVDVDVDWAVLDSITCDRAVKRVPGGVVCTGRLAS